MRTKQQFSQLMRKRIRDKNWVELFTAGGCYFFALVLHEKLHLPLFYASFPDSTEFKHVFVMQDGQCIDYTGKSPIEVVAKNYAGWSDEKPRPTCSSDVKMKIKKLGCGEELEGEIYEIARREFERRKEIYL